LAGVQRHPGPHRHSEAVARPKRALVLSMPSHFLGRGTYFRMVSGTLASRARKPRIMGGRAAGRLFRRVAWIRDRAAHSVPRRAGSSGERGRSPGAAAPSGFICGGDGTIPLPGPGGGRGRVDTKKKNHESAPEDPQTPGRDANIADRCRPARPGGRLSSLPGLRTNLSPGEEFGLAAADDPPAMFRPHLHITKSNCPDTDFVDKLNPELRRRDGDAAML